MSDEKKEKTIPIEDTKKEAKKDTPLQEQIKEQLAQEINQDIPTEKPKKKKRGRPKKTKPKEPDQEELMQQGAVLCEVLELIRANIGCPNPEIPPMQKLVFVKSLAEITQKYGSFAYMPEVMFVGSLGMILFDTYSQVKPQKTKEKQEDRKEPKFEDRVYP